MSTLSMEADKGTEEMVRNLSSAKQLPYVALPLLKKARLAIVDRESILEIPSKLDLDIGIQYLTFGHSFANTASIVDIINHTYRLESFAYRPTFGRHEAHHWANDHISFIDALKSRGASTLKDIQFHVDFQDH